VTRIAASFVVAWAVFGPLLVLDLLLARTGPPWLAQAVVKSGLLAFSVAAIAVDRRRSFAAYGFRRPHSMQWLRATATGVLLGMLATTAIVFSPAAGMKHMFEGYGLLGVIGWIWFYSSLGEEIFTRGWFQSLAAAGEPSGGVVRRSVVASGLLFGSMHLSLLLRNSDGWTVFIIVMATTLLGLVAAHLRAMSGSVWPAFVTHVSFNAGGAVAGVVLTVASLATNGTIPRP
jgi:hypothetical protein